MAIVNFVAQLGQLRSSVHDLRREELKSGGFASRVQNGASGGLQKDRRIPFEECADIVAPVVRLIGFHRFPDLDDENIGLGLLGAETVVGEACRFLAVLVRDLAYVPDDIVAVLGFGRGY
ncbi:hypothetical protein [Breoghania sp.]|uniref:hypothetical protein n=1 Tax=Breoghania sp. TaxID=2065378 RepID=UPI002633C2B0|nr:hypothetical protein [Breoghania sp.]MDJ0932584.1 hypothetical protein [Breoghania sp.]